MATEALTEFLNEIPPPAEIKRRIAENRQEAAVLRRLLKLSQDHHRSDPDDREAAR